MPTAPHSDYVKFLGAYGPEMVELTLRVRDLVLAEAAGAVELIYDAYNAVAAGYSFTGRPSEACIHVATYAKWVNLGFNYGATLPDPERRLKGSGSRVRHVRITSAADLKDPAVRNLVKEAVRAAIYPEKAVKGGSVVRAIYERRRRPGR